jgi:regulation of enolase protein 1 (concanavalin A-like superfamily)
LTSDPQLDGEQAGLILYRSDGDYIKLVKEFKGTPHIILVREEDDKPVVIAKVECPTQRVVLDLVLTDGRVRARFRTDDNGTWRAVGDCTPLRKTPLVGLFAHVWPGASERWVKFSTFRIQAERESPFQE